MALLNIQSCYLNVINNYLCKHNSDLVLMQILKYVNLMKLKKLEI